MLDCPRRLFSDADGGAMDLSDFDLLFKRLTGREPYPWQRRLYRRFAELSEKPCIPDRLDLPTGLGKTSVMAVWLAARINGAELPRRLVYLVDRRAVVDQATEEAEALGRRLDALIAGDHGDKIIERLQLRPLHAGAKETLTALPISTLRGQFLDNRRWLQDPASAAIVVGTVDMIGSRLLFGGYGVSRSMRPVHAALLGIDSLVLLDEAHLAAPFEAMLRGVSRLIGEDGEALDEARPAAMRPLAVLALTATGAAREGAAVFGLEPQDWADDRTVARLEAPKRVRLEPEVAPGKLVDTLADLAWDLRVGEDGAGRRVVVFCNSRTTAQKVEEALRKRVQAKEAYGKGAELTALLVGERRFYERDQELKKDHSVLRQFIATSERDVRNLPAFLVATSAGEVGVDLDADDLVCDLVAWERMVQRLGRVNRRVAPGTARVCVVPVAGDKEAEDEIDDPRLKLLRSPFDCGLWETAEDGAFDGSPAGLIRLKDAAKAAGNDVLDRATTPEPLRPPLTRPTVEAWSLTSLETHTGRPKVEPWLRGWVEKEPQTRVVWRRWLPLREDETKPTRALRDYLEHHAAPHVSEALEAPSWRVAEVLRDRAKSLLKARKGETAAEPADEAVGSEPEVDGGPEPRQPVVAVRLSAEDEVREVYTLDALEKLKPDTLVRDLAGGTMVMDARMGGLSATGLLDGKAAHVPVTVDAAEGWKADLRITTGWRVWPDKDQPQPDKTKDGRWALSVFRWASDEADSTLKLWVQDWRGVGRNPGDPAIARAAQTLQVHHDWAGCEADRIAEALRLGPAHKAMLVAATRAHDLGKARDLWQNAMGAERGGGRPYAKTTGGANGLALNGYRHEFGSLLDVLADPETHLGDVDTGLRDLALHLIAAHHGRVRPTVKAFDPDQRIDLSPPFAQAAALNFAALQAEWGPWGLAWWEALLRAADWAASAELNAQPDGDAAEPDERAAHG